MTTAISEAIGSPVAVVVPCHRVVKADGALLGYRWGVERKAKLLAPEECAALAARYRDAAHFRTPVRSGRRHSCGIIFHDAA